MPAKETLERYCSKDDLLRFFFACPVWPPSRCPAEGLENAPFQGSLSAPTSSAFRQPGFQKGRRLTLLPGTADGAHVVRMLLHLFKLAPWHRIRGLPCPCSGEGGLRRVFSPLLQEGLKGEKLSQKPEEAFGNLTGMWTS